MTPEEIRKIIIKPEASMEEAFKVVQAFCYEKVGREPKSPISIRPNSHDMELLQFMYNEAVKFYNEHLGIITVLNKEGQQIMKI